MKTYYLIILPLAFLLYNIPVFAQDDQLDKTKIEINSADSIEYDLLVFDPKFDTYLATVPYSKEFYSNEYYRSWNILYCAEWNSRHQNIARYGDFYETHIDYDQSIDYGIDFNFKLYQYFQFIEKEYGIVLINRGRN